MSISGSCLCWTRAFIGINMRCLEITEDATGNHIIRQLESIAYQTHDVFNMGKIQYTFEIPKWTEAFAPIQTQFQADILDTSSNQSVSRRSTWAAYLVGLAVGFGRTRMRLRAIKC